MRATTTLSEYKAHIETWIYKRASVIFDGVPELLEIYLKLVAQEYAHTD